MATTEAERLRDRNQGIAPPSNATDRDLRAKDDLICQLKTAALEMSRLRDRCRRNWKNSWLASIER